MLYTALLQISNANEQKRDMVTRTNGLQSENQNCTSSCPEAC